MSFKNFRKKSEKRPKLKFPSTLEECLVAVDKIEKEAVEKLEQMGLNNNGGLGLRFSL